MIWDAGLVAASKVVNRSSMLPGLSAMVVKGMVRCDAFEKVTLDCMHKSVFLESKSSVEILIILGDYLILDAC